MRSHTRSIQLCELDRAKSTAPPRRKTLCKSKRALSLRKDRAENLSLISLRVMPAKSFADMGLSGRGQNLVICALRGQDTVANQQDGVEALYCRVPMRNGDDRARTPKPFERIHDE